MSQKYTAYIRLKTHCSRCALSLWCESIVADADDDQSVLNIVRMSKRSIEKAKCPSCNKKDKIADRWYMEIE